ncbi:MAG: hypothetical protein AAFR02_01100, partial [Pseudomonadota bacterium]
EERLKQSEAGKAYLYGQEARDVAEAVHKEDAEARKKAAEAKQVAEMEARAAENPPIKAAEVSAEEVRQTEGQKKAAEAMAFLARRAEERKSGPKVHEAASVQLEDEKKRQKGQNPGDDYGM